jgi:molybdopterin-guanine dinucleotide biosynthesis protein A
MLPPNLSGFVLAGGKSTRMGRDKATLALDGRTLLEHAIAVLRGVVDEVCILGSQQLYSGYDAPVIEDIYPGCGPLGGIHAALTHTKRTFNLIIAVDTPFLAPAFLSFMAERAMNTRAVVTTPEIAGFRQPLCSVYSREFLAIAEAALQPRRSQRNTGKSKDFKIVPLFPEPGTLVITEPQMAKFAFTPEMFENLNTPEDLERARRRGMKA